MKYLLTSAGIKNDSIRNELVRQLGKPIEESSALLVSTAIYPFNVGPHMAHKVASGQAKSPLGELGWRSLGLLELTALPTIKEEAWLPVLEDTDALLVFGGDVLYLAYWMKKSGLANRLPHLQNLVYVGVSAGSIVTTAFNPDFESNLETIPSGNDRASMGNRALGFHDFALCVHLDHPDPMFEDSSSANVEKWASSIPVPTYAIDDQSALSVVDGRVEVITEGHWRLFNPKG